LRRLEIPEDMQKKYGSLKSSIAFFELIP